MCDSRETAEVSTSEMGSLYVVLFLTVLSDNHLLHYIKRDLAVAAGLFFFSDDLLYFYQIQHKTILVAAALPSE